MSGDSTPMDPPLRARLRDDSLWEFALALYARDGVETACLTLQDEAGVDVCELLWHCWLFHHGVVCLVDPPALAEVRTWQREVTAPLRTLRRRLKPAARHDRGVAEVRRQLQRAELAAEREALARLQRIAESAPCCRTLSQVRSGLVETLASRLQLRKKSQLLALETLKGQLDPP